MAESDEAKPAAAEEKPGGTVTATPRDFRDGDRITEGLPDELGQASATVTGASQVSPNGMATVYTTAGEFLTPADTEWRVRR